jgi:signal peptidase I
MIPKLGRQRLRAVGIGLPVLILALALQVAQAATVESQNLVSLIQHSDRILVGTVESISDGFDGNNVPYTEIRLRVSDHIRGEEGDTITFRQFGLLAPREIDGRTYLGTSPDGWPKWIEKERVMVFLGPPARLTGLQTTVGLQSGKLRMSNGQLSNAAGNVGIFDGLKVEANGLSRDQLEMLANGGQAVDANPFISLVRRAVDENWIEKGVMHNEK